ncbi:disks large-associated protein 1-like [Thrips palmi]|uniref:Disks large-associated protein 1-like n=1 Tax=Thrips palmi TaxID=161013 RepID=A0A6P9A004_THRPL|nr:disks large-associated protein 1-like [Thrips palmi]
MVSCSHYRDLLQRERAAIAGLCDEWQRVLDFAAASSDKDKDSGLPIPEDVCGKIQIAVGQAQLLMRKKFVQFSGLIQACEEDSAERPPVTVEDLQGFWELVHIQVADIHSKFSEVDKLRDNNWEPLPLQENQRKPLGNLNKPAANGPQRRKPASVVTKDFSMEAKERLAQAKAMIRKRMKEQCCQ